MLGRLAVGNGSLEIWDQAVEIDVGVHLATLGSIVVQRVDLEDLHDQCLDVLDVQLEFDRIVGSEQSCVGGNEVQVDPLLELLVLFGRQQCRPTGRVVLARDDLRLGEELLEVAI